MNTKTKLLLTLSLLLISCQPCVHAQLDTSASGARAKIDDLTAIRCVLGEYESGNLTELTATAEALRNRINSMGETKALKGVYGCKAVSESGGVFKRGARIIPDYAAKMAFKAWEASKTSNYTRSATHWESTDFKRPYWSKSMVLTKQIGKHCFYKNS